VIIGLGQPFAGDDGVGRVVARRLAAEGIPALEASDAGALLELLDGGRVILVDAAIDAGEPGTVLSLDAGSLATLDRPLSSHGLSVPDALALAQAFGRAPTEVWVVAIAIAPPRIGDLELSPPVAAAIPEAMNRVRALL
jgi:hydrogenase maturation protease